MQWQQPDPSSLLEYRLLTDFSFQLLSCFEMLHLSWPGKLLAGNTIAACFRPAVQLMWQLMRQDVAASAAAVTHSSGNTSSSGAGSSSNSSNIAASVRLRPWFKAACHSSVLALHIVTEVGLPQPDLPWLPQQSIELLAEPELYRTLATALGERFRNHNHQKWPGAPAT
jgi:hypothetical protein